LLYLELGNFGVAEPLFKRALAISEKKLGAYHTDLAQVLENMALMYEKMDRKKQAESFAKRAERIRELADND
jgi:tetratricopeptide (TPR) repeat protein